jgi:adenylate kinase family enzyme
MKIALIGAPGSGKTDLAKKLAEKYDANILDDYVENIGKESNLAMADQASYIGNLYVILRRIAMERWLIEKEPDKNLITCGTLVESSIYATVEALRYQTEVHQVRIIEFMKMLGLIIQDTWDYDHAFILNLDEDADSESVAGNIDASIFMAVNSFGLHYTPLTGDTEERFKQAVEDIEKRERELQAIDPNFIQGTPATPVPE